MTVKVEMEKNKDTGVIALAFETNDTAGQEIIDAVRVAIMGEHPKRGGYLNSNRFVVHVNPGE